MLFSKFGYVGILGSLLTISFAQAEELYTVTLNWGVIEYADSYQLEEYKPNGNNFEIVYVGSGNQIILNDRPIGDYRYRVIGCIYLDGDPAQTACSSDYAFYSEEALFTISEKMPRRIIYLHTDILGSVAAETNEQGELNQ